MTSLLKHTPATLAALAVAAPLVLAGCAPVQLSEGPKSVCGQAAVDVGIDSPNESPPSSFSPTCTPKDGGTP